MKVLVRQIATGLYWKTGTGWVQAEDAEVFAESAAALFYCIKNEMRDVHVILSFDDPNYDVVLHPFGEKGYEPTSRELVEQSRRLKEQSEAAREMSRQNLKKMRELLAGARQTAAEIKETRKTLPFRRKDAGAE